MSDLIDLAGSFGLILLALTLIWVGRYNLRLKQTRKGLLFLLSGLAIIAVTVKALYSSFW